MKKLIEHTYGTHIYMRMELDGQIEDIDVYIKESGMIYKTTGDQDPQRRKSIIAAFNKLY